MAQDSRLGLEGVVHRNTASYGTPTWVTIDNVKDLTLELSKGKADTSSRANSGWKAYRGTLKEGTLTLNMIWIPNAGDADQDALLDSYLNGTQIDMAVLDGPITTPGFEGLRAYMEVVKFSRGEPLEEAMTIDVELCVSHNNTNPPTWYTAS